MRILAIDYGEARVGIAITDPLGITAQGLETIYHKNNDKLILKRLEELLKVYEIDTLVVGMPLNLKGEKTVRAQKTEEFIHKLKCKFNKHKKRGIVDTLAAVYILESYMNQKNG